MMLTVALMVGIAAAAGVYLALSRDVFRCVIGISILGSAANLLLFAAGRLYTEVPPLVPAGVEVLSGAANPLPQALVLTAIVIGFALTCFSLVLIVRLVQASGSDDAEEIRYAEPRPDDPLKPPVEDAPDRSQALIPQGVARRVGR